MTTQLTLGTDYALAICLAAPQLVSRGDQLPSVVGMIAGRPLACMTEVVYARPIVERHLQRHHPWLINAVPPIGLLRERGPVVLMCWIDRMIERHGPTLTVPQLVDAKLPPCPTHGRRAA
jgi:hypothetical protein